MTLVDVAEEGDLSELARRLDAGADVNASDPDGRTALHAALAEGHADAARLLLARGADPTRRDELGFGTLHWATYANDEAILELAAGRSDPSVDPVDKEGRTPLSWAVQSNSTVSVRWLLARGADPNRIDNDGWAPLHHVAPEGHLEAIVLLLAGGADPLRRLPGSYNARRASDLVRQRVPDRADVLAVLAAAENGRTGEA